MRCAIPSFVRSDVAAWGTVKITQKARKLISGFGEILGSIGIIGILTKELVVF
jgi:hypothetical protein